MYCENCGARVDDDSRFCENCGTLIEQQPEEQTAQDVTDLDQLMEMDQPRQQAEEPSAFDKTVVFEMPGKKEEPEPEFEPEPEEEEHIPVEQFSYPEEADEDESAFEIPEVLQKGETAVIEGLDAVAEREEQAPSFEEEEEPLEPEPDSRDISRPLFCMACGRALPEGAAFCDGCGTPTGEVAPVQVGRRRENKNPAVDLIKGFFQKPAETIAKAAEESAFSAGIAFFAVKDVILAVLAAIFMKRLSATLGLLGTWLAGGDPFGFGTKIFLVGIVLDALWVGILYGLGIVFRAEGSVKALAGACGTAGILPGVMLIITAVLAAFAPAAAFCAVLVTAAAALVCMNEAVSGVLKMDENKRLYMVAASAACYVIILFAVLNLLA